MSETSPGVVAPGLSPSALVQMMIDRGHAVPIQVNVKGGFIVYEFLGGVYDGVKMRLYPPFLRVLTFGSEHYVLSGPKNRRSPRMTYRLEA